MLGDNQKHFEELMKEYKAFYDEYQETKKFPEMPVIVNNTPVVKEENQNAGGAQPQAQAQGQPQAAAGEEKDKNQSTEQKQENSIMKVMSGRF